MFALYLMAGMSFYVQVEKVAVNTYGENYKHAKPTMPPQVGQLLNMGRSARRSSN